MKIRKPSEPHSVPCTASLPSRTPFLPGLDEDLDEDGTTASAEVLPTIFADSLSSSESTRFPSYGSTHDKTEDTSPHRISYRPGHIRSNFAHLESSPPHTPRREPIGSDSVRGRRASDLLVHSLISSLRDAHGPSSQRRQEGIVGRLGEPTEAVVEEQSQSDKAQRVIPTWVSGWNVLNMIQGIGILGIPYACASAGWVSIPIILVVAILCCFTGRLIGETLYQYPEEHCENYFQSRSQVANRIRVRSTTACVAATVFPRFGSRMTGAIVITELFGASVLYTILLGQAASALLTPLVTPALPANCWTVIMTYICLPLLLYPRMRIIAWFSVIALIGLFCSILLVLIYCFLELPQTPHLWSNLPSPSLAQLPVSLSIIVFSYCAHAVLPGIEGTMRHPEQYGRMMNISFTIAAVIKVIFGLLAAMIFGKGVAQAVTDSMVKHRGLVISVHVAVLINVMFSLPLVFYILGEQLDCAITSYVGQGFFASHRLCSLYTLWFVSSRYAIINLGLVFGTMVPHFALVMGMIGAVTGSLLCFIFPGYFHLHLFWSHLTRCGRFLRILICIFGVLMGVFGVALSGRSIHEAFVNDE